MGKIYASEEFTFEMYIFAALKLDLILYSCGYMREPYLNFNQGVQ